VAGFLKPTGGEIRIGARSCTGAAAIAASSSRTSRSSFLATAQRKRGIRPADAGVRGGRARGHRARFLRLVDLERFAGAYPHELSGGISRPWPLRAPCLQPVGPALDERSPRSMA